MMSGLSKILKALQNKCSNLFAMLSSVPSMFRAAIAPSSSTVQSAVQFVVSTFRVEHSILTQTYLEAVQTVRSSNTFSTISRLISSFGSLVIKTILSGCTCRMCGMVLIVEGASRLAETKRVKCITNRFSAKDSKRKKA